MKNICLYVVICCMLCLNATAQKVTKAENEEPAIEKEKGFKKENLFTGGSVGLGFSNGTFNFALGPYFGYSLNNYVDVALSLNYSYVSQRDNVEENDKLRQSIIAPGAFVRVYPVKFLFVHAQYDQNFIKLKYIPAPNGTYVADKFNKSVGSFLVGAGFANGREDEPSFYYISVLFDVAKNEFSPNLDAQGRITPLIKAGYNIALFQNNKSRASRQKRERDFY